MQIRPFRNADRAALIALWQTCGLIRPWNDPEADIELALATEGTALLVAAADDGALIGSAMAGFDGHRGWLYYLASHPDRRGEGIGRALTRACEAHLKDLGCPKVELIVRSENEPVQAFYERIGYRLDPPIDYYRYVQETIGDPWLWWGRKVLSNEELAEIVKDDAVEIYLLQLGGAPAGMIELDFRKMPEVANINYLGLMRWCIGRGFGPYLLDWGIRCAWERDPAPQRLTVDTCTLDHPKALAGYQKAGFQVYDRTLRKDPDPRARGLVPPHVEVLSDVPPLARQ
jgi:ribosomal protein S18 acetylase RimI-like enzyme